MAIGDKARVGHTHMLSHTNAPRYRFCVTAYNCLQIFMHVFTLHHKHEEGNAYKLKETDINVHVPKRPYCLSLSVDVAS